MDAMELKEFYARLGMYEFLKVLFDLDEYNARLPKEIQEKLRSDISYVKCELLLQIERGAYGGK